MHAHDADLNDTLRYSLGQSEHAHLFELAPASGQLSWRTGARQLNASTHQLLVHVADTLDGGSGAAQSARVIVHVAPQLVGRSINFDAPAQADNNNNSKLSNELDTSAAAAKSGATKQTRATSAAAAAQRSSVATVMSSLQHMVRSFSFFDMPMSSALLLSVLLALLVCLLLVVVLSMTLHVYKRRTKHKRQRHHMAAAAHFRQQQLRVASCAAPTNTSARYARPPSSAGSSTPTHSTGAGDASGATSASTSTAALATISAAVHNAPKSSRVSFGNQQQRASPPHDSRTSSRLSMVGRLGAKVAPLSATTATAIERATACASKSPAPLDCSLVSSLSSGAHSKRSFGNTDTSTTTTDDSSVMHCGHYSVSRISGSPVSSDTKRPQAERRARKHAKQQQQRQKQPVEASLRNIVRDLVVATTTQLPQPQQHHDEPEKRSRSTQVLREELAELTNSQPDIKAYRKLPLGSLARPLRKSHASDANSQQQQQQQASDSAIASDASSASASNYRSTSEQLDGLMALIRQRGTQPDTATRLAQLQTELRAVAQSDASPIKWPADAAPSRPKRLTWDDELDGSPLSPQSRAHEDEPTAISVAPDECDLCIAAVCQSTSAIDEDSECFVAPEVQLRSAMAAATAAANKPQRVSPLVGNHVYMAASGDETDERHQFAEEHFLFSSACTFNADTMQQPQQQQQQQQNNTTNNSIGLSDQQPQQSNQQLAQQNHEDNCLDYTIVQSSQFHVDAFAAAASASASTSARHTQVSSPSAYQQAKHQHQHQQQQLHHQDLSALMTSAVL